MTADTNLPSRRHASTGLVLRAGFAAFLFLLVVSAWEAHSIQDAVSRRHIEIYRVYVKQEDRIIELIQLTARVSSDVRAFMLDESADRMEKFRKVVAGQRSLSFAALDDLDRLQPGGAPRQQFRATLREFWDAIEVIAARHYDMVSVSRYLQDVVMPQRSLLWTTMNNLIDMNQEAVQRSETDFTLASQNAMKRLFGMLGISVLLGLMVATFSLRHAENLERETANQYDEVRLAKRNLELLSGRLLEVQEEERRSLSRELHDEIGQILTAIKIEISRAHAVAESAEVKERLERAKHLADHTVQTVRNIAGLLRPSLLDDLGLVPALQWQLENFYRRSGIACDFHEQDIPEDLPDAVKTCVYRVAQEALHNCEKHSGATRITISLVNVNDVLSLEVRDNGRGFELGENGRPLGRGGFGVMGMRERAAFAGGAVRMQSAPGQGTAVELTIPLEETKVPDAHSHTAR